MKKKTRILSLLLLAILLFNVLPLATVAAEPVQIVAEQETAKLSVANVTGVAGETTEVKLSLTENPGLASLKFDVAYDAYMTLTNVTFGDAFANTMITAATPYKNPQTISMVSPLTENNATGLFATLTFAVSEETPDGYIADITVTYAPNDVCDGDYNNVILDVDAGSVTVYEGKPGDIDGNGEVDNKDAILLFRYVAGWDVDVDTNAVDTNGDNRVDNKDAIELFRYVAGWPGITIYRGAVCAHTLVYHAAKEATCTEDGSIEYWSCADCGRLFADAAGMNAIKLEDTVIAKGDHVTPNEGLIDRKIEILLLINDYKAQAEAVIALIMTNGNPATALDNCVPYANIIENLDWWYEYVTLAINLDGVKEGIEDYVENAMRTNVDEIYDLLANASVITVTPAPYVDGALGVDTIGDLLDAIAELRAELVDQFGDIIADEWMANYLPAGAEDTIDLDTVIADITVLHGALTLFQEAAAEIVDDINNITLVTDRATIEAIWANVKAWGEDAFFTLDSAMEIYDNLVYNMSIPECVITIDGAEVSYAAYEITKESIITYYIYNLEDLADASIILDVLVIDELVAAIPEYIIYSNTSVDSKAAIKAAEEAIAAFKDTYSDEIYNEFCLVDGVDVFGEAVVAARAEYDALVAEAANVNDLITKLPAADDITKDYEGSALKAAYDAYCLFAEHNADATTKYTDVITDEADLIDCIDQYIELAYVDQRGIIATVKIYAAAKAKIDDIFDFAFREAIYVYAEDSIAIVNAIAYDNTGIDNFNRIDILSANLDKIADEAQEYAAVIAAARYAEDLK